ncbi:hypothetical protein BX666DRAFT_1999873 [Dichotomocladium elegans]|nr:hypothetical protein BX666DRAFT_1999873 [Dichotomocladium elegans]
MNTASPSSSNAPDLLAPSIRGKTRPTCFTNHEFLNHLTSTAATTTSSDENAKNGNNNNNSCDWLPEGWKVDSRRRSLLQVETNIQTLGELCRALSDIRNQLPSPVTAAVEETMLLQRRRVSTAPATPVVANTMEGETTPISLLGSPGTFDQFAQQLSQYPLPVFDALVRLHLDCTSYQRTNKPKFLQQYHQGLTHPALACAIYAYSAIHAIICHPDQFGIYPFMDQLARDAYHLAVDLIEFDKPSKSTVETLVLMHLYCVVAMGARQHNYLSMAEMHMMTLFTNNNNQQDTYRLLAWMHHHDLLLAMRTLSPPILQHERYGRIPIKPLADHERLSLEALELELEGLEKIARKQDLANWRETIQTRFPLRPQGDPQTNRYGLRLHCIYFCGKLQRHQSDMMDALDVTGNTGACDWNSNHNYRHHPPVISAAGSAATATTDRVENALMDCMWAGLGLVQTILSLLQTNDRCLMMDLIDTLSTAYSILYYGNKMLEHPIAACQDAMVSLLKGFESSSSMMQSSGIQQFVQRWRCVLFTIDR